jgi:L-lactate dehydrogenase complex protein LldF
MHLGTEGFQDHARQALKDEPLQNALHLLTNEFVPRRVKAMEALGDPEALRTQARAVKEEAIAGLDTYLEQFADNLDSLGARVHWAHDAAEARDIITAISQQASAKVIVKGKSMAAEEIHLNPHLEELGYEVLETDLGEYIIQLAEETPSHIIAPAIHKTRQQIATLLHDKIGEPYTEELPGMTQIARRALRQQFLRADVGITGVNFAIADTGSIVLVTNEGNGRLSSTLPRVHIALMGMEKIIPRLDDLPVMLKVLTNSATGQKISSYVTMITGPRRAHDLDGPEELHVVVMDNGRSGILGSENREALYCLRCGACLNVCPIYQNIGGHAYGWVYPGPIGSIVTPALVGIGQAKDLPNASTLCGACRDACPVQINIPRMLLHLRHNIAEGQGSYQDTASDTAGLLARGFATVMSNPVLLNLGRKIGRTLLRPVSKGGLLGQTRIPLVSRWTRSRDLPIPASRSFGEIWRDELSGTRSDRNRP